MTEVVATINFHTSSHVMFAANGRRLLVTLALLVVVAYAGFLLSKLYYNGQSSRPRPTSGESRPTSRWWPTSGESRPTSRWRPTSGESRPTSRWKLFGDAFISDEERTQPGVQRLSVEQGKQVRLLTDSLLIRSGDVAVKELVRGLESSQVYCHTYPENEGVIQRKYAKFLEVLANYTAFHKQEKNGEGTKRLIWICDVHKLCGGLADRVRGVAYALIPAMLSQRVLILDWRNSQFGEQSFLQPNTIDWRLSEANGTAYEKSQMLERSGSGPKDLHIFSVPRGIGVWTICKGVWNLSRESGSGFNWQVT